MSNLLHAGKQRLKDLRAAHTAVDRAYDKDNQGEIDAAFDRLDSLRNAIAADLDTLAAARKAAEEFAQTMPLCDFRDHYGHPLRNCVELHELLKALGVDGTEP
jgi:hypothetical protein